MISFGHLKMKSKSILRSKQIILQSSNKIKSFSIIYKLTLLANILNSTLQIKLFCLNNNFWTILMIIDIIKHKSNSLNKFLHLLLLLFIKRKTQFTNKCLIFIWFINIVRMMIHFELNLICCKLYYVSSYIYWIFFVVMND